MSWILARWLVLPTAKNHLMKYESLIFLPEPKIEFGYQQVAEDPRFGLFAFGPLEERRPQAVKIGVIGSPLGIGAFLAWSRKVSGVIPAVRSDVGHHVSFPGFEVAFRSKWLKPVVEIPISELDLSTTIRNADRHRAIFDSVSVFENKIRDRLRTDDLNVDVWFVVVPDEIYLYGRPLSRIPTSERVNTGSRMNAKLALRLQREPSLFEEDMQAAELYQFELNFHHQLKARLLDVGAVVQVVRESTLTPSSEPIGATSRQRQDDATVAWNLCTTTFFKAGGRPWKLERVRDGVCYVGIVFKRVQQSVDERNACCGAQMFLDSGDGLVFKGAMGPWYSEDSGEFHLPYEEANRLIVRLVDSYTAECGRPPIELFIHGRVRFSDEEARGFSDGATETKVTCVSIRRSNEFKLFRGGSTPVLRGTAYVASRRKAFLWTSGFIPFLGTYPGREVPNPISIDVTHGSCDIGQVIEDVFGLTKLNFNACIYGDGIPVTLRFADAVGEILTAAPLSDLPPLPFRHYI
jgi:hypothetical protein